MTAWDITDVGCGFDDCPEVGAWLCPRHEVVYCETHADDLDYICHRCSDPMVEF